MLHQIDMVSWIYQRELSIKFLCCGLVLLLNLAALYLIADLHGYDVAVKYLTNGGEQSETLQWSLAVLFLVVVANVLLTCSWLIKHIFQNKR